LSHPTNRSCGKVTSGPLPDPGVNESKSRILTIRLCAAFALALGMVTLVGWIFGIPVLVQIRPDWTPMVVNTAVGFVLGGSGLSAAVARGRWGTWIATVFAVLLILLALEEFCVLIFDLSPALSLPDLHRPLQPDYLHPGRMAPNTALSYLLLGLGLLAALHSRGGAIALWAQRFATGVVAIGALGVIGYSLQLEYLYSWTGVVRMAVHTGVGMVVLGIGLWNLVPARVIAPMSVEGREVAGVYRTATMLLLLVAASAGIGGFGFLQSEVEHQARDGLIQATVDRIVLFDQAIEHRSSRAQVVSDDDEMIALLRALALSPGNTAVLGELRARASRMRPNGFSSIAVEIAGRHWQLDGAPIQPALAVRLRGSFPGWLLWKDGYVLRRALPVRDTAGEIGTLITEQPLPTLAVMSASSNRLGGSSEMAMCGADAVMMHCFPMRRRDRPSDIARVIAGQPLPMDHALRGQTGSIIALDYGQHRVLAAYGPIGNTGLGLVVKRDIAEIYAPIRQQFQRIMLFLGALLLFGLWLMRRRLRPLLAAMEESRAQARASSVRFEAAVESNLDAFFILECVRDLRGTIHDMRYTLLNAGAEAVLARPRAEALGRGMCELFPELRTDGFLDCCVRVVETGEPAVIERTAVVRQMHWYHMQLVKLGDGIGLTVRDVTVERLAVDRIRYQALHDPLTGLANRVGFEQALAEAMIEAGNRGQTVALALLDLDRFKQINDTLGHAAGDQLLKEVATRLRDCMRPSDTVARLGGDEFVLVLPNIDYPDGALTVARKVIAQVAQPVQLEGQTVAVTVSIGISAFPRDGTDAAALLKCADAAMYRAKSAGRNGHAVFDSTST
jgi:diguanylate cyclase (GGDEF)-like protein